MLEESGEHLLHPGVQPFFVGRPGVPRGDRGGSRRQCRVFWDEAELLLILERDLALPIPAVIELSLVLVGPFPGHMVRAVTRTRREVEEERLLRCACLLLA